MRLNIFGAIKDAFKYNKVAEHPYYLDAKDVEGVRAARASEGWPAVQKLIDNAVNVHAETLLRTDDSEQLHYFRGYIAGLRGAMMLVEHTSKRDDLGKELKHERDPGAERRERRLRAATYASPAWRTMG